MKKLAAIGISLALLVGATACAEHPQPEPTKSESLHDCAEAAFEYLKLTYGIDYLVERKEEANAYVMEVCT